MITPTTRPAHLGRPGAGRPRPAARHVLVVALVLAGCDAGTPSPERVDLPLPPGGAAPTSTALNDTIPVPQVTVLLWLDPEFSPEASPRLQAVLDGWRAAHPEARLEVAVRPARGATAASAFLDALAGVAPGRLPGVAVVPLDAVPALRERGLASAIDADPFADRIAQAFPFAAQLGSDGDGAVWAVPFAADVAHIVGTGGAVGTWDALAPGEQIVVPPPAADPGSLAAALASYAAADGQLDALATPDDAALTVAFGALETARGQGQVRVANTPLPLGPLREADGAHAAVVAAGGYVRHAAQGGGAVPASFPELGAATWGPLPGIDRAAPPVAWGWGLIVPPGDTATRALVFDLVERMSRPEDNVWVVDHGHLPVHPAALAAVFANPALPEGADAYGEFLAGQLQSAAAIAAPEAEWERWVAALSALYLGKGITAAVAELVPEQ